MLLAFVATLIDIFIILPLFTPSSPRQPDARRRDMSPRWANEGLSPISICRMQQPPRLHRQRFHADYFASFLS